MRFHQLVLPILGLFGGGFAAGFGVRGLVDQSSPKLQYRAPLVVRGGDRPCPEGAVCQEWCAPPQVPIRIRRTSPTGLVAEVSFDQKTWQALAVMPKMVDSIIEWPGGIPSPPVPQE